jgi:UrcA family protein
MYTNHSIMNFTKRIACVVLAAAPIAMVAGGAQAQESGDAPAHMAVSYADLNLNSDAGIAVLYKRLRHAARQVCGDGDTTSLSRGRDQTNCINNAMSQAVAQVNSPILTSLYEAKTGQPERKQATLAQAR